MSLDRELYDEQLDVQRCLGCGCPVSYDEPLQLCGDCVESEVRTDQIMYTPTPDGLREAL